MVQPLRITAAIGTHRWLRSVVVVSAAARLVIGRSPA